MLNKQADAAGKARALVLLAAVFVGVPCVAAPICDRHIYFEGCPVERVALWDVLVERCPTVDPDFERKVEALKRRWDVSPTPDDERALLDLRKSEGYPGALKEAEDWFDGLPAASKKDFCDAR